jgi:hypothetical protein
MLLNVQSAAPHCLCGEDDVFLQLLSCEPHDAAGQLPDVQAQSGMHWAAKLEKKRSAL